MVFALPAGAAKTPENPPQHVIVAPVRVAEISDRLEALGTAQANETVSLTANVSEKIRAIHFEDGQQVQAGDVLVVLEHDEEKADLEQARALLGDRQLALQRARRLAKQQLVSTEELDRARLAVDQAKASLDAIQARIDDRIIRAPFAGVVGLRNISLGTLVESGKLITNLDDTRLIKLDFTVAEVFLAELRPGLKIRASATALGEQAYEGEVKSIDSRVDPVTRSVQVRAVLPNADGRILPGILMQVELLRNTRQAMLIPEAALLPLGEKQFVMLRTTQDGKQIATKREVKIGTRLRGQVEIIQGLSAGEQVVTHGSSKLKPGGLLNILAVDDGSTDIETIIKGQAIKAQQP